MIIKNLLYILQLDLYNIKSFLNFSYTHLEWWKLEKRSKLQWTKKILLILVVTMVFEILIIFSSLAFLGFYGIFVLTLVIPALPLLIAIASILIKPIDLVLKKKLLEKARKVFEENSKNLTVIGITGSYGKTSTREILSTILHEKLETIKLDDNINTDLGIAEFILKNPTIFREKDVFVVEMGAYKKGEIKKICDLVKPDYSILTGINESHLSRFGSLENIIQAKFELAENTKNASILSLDDENVKNNYQRFNINNPIGISQNQAKDVKILDDFQGLEFTKDNIVFRAKLLAPHNISLILLSLEIAKKLELIPSEMKQGVEKIDYIPHRLQPIRNEQTGVLVIDDSYNGNFNGIVSGIKVLNKTKGRKIVLTPGLVELGNRSKEIHQKIGKLYAENEIDLVMLIKNEATRFITEGLKGESFENYKIYSSTEEAHADLPNIMKNSDTIIFQNDLPDNYF